MERYVERLKQGDLGASLPWKDLHGLTTTGAAIADLAFHLRQKVAVGQEINTVLYQSVEALPLAVLVWDGEGDLQTTNGLARRLFSFHQHEGESQALEIFFKVLIFKRRLFKQSKRQNRSKFSSSWLIQGKSRCPDGFMF